MPRRILILGGTGEARILAARLAARPDLALILSLAGRTEKPAMQPVPVRIGGFGGVEGLCAYLRENRIAAVIDATHPYAAVMSAHAAAACGEVGVPLVAVRRPPWTPEPGDRWQEVDGIDAAVAALGPAPRRAFLALGRNEVRAFEAAPQHAYLVRSVDPVVPPLAVADATYVLGRGPFSVEDDHALLAAHRIEVVLAKNSGGTATYGKIAAARALGLAVILLRRPDPPDVPAAAGELAALAWVERLFPQARAPHDAERGE